MIGAILFAGLGGAASSLLAALSNIIVWRKFPSVREGAETELPEAIFLRVTCYRLAANLFYRQAIILWLLCGLLIIIDLLLAMMACTGPCPKLGLVEELARYFSSMCSRN